MPHSHADDSSAGRVILWSLILVAVGTQAAVVQWKRVHPRSFNLLSLLGLWVVPPAWVASRGVGALLTSPFAWAWLLFSLLMAALIFAVRARTLDSATPGVVYGVLEAVYLQCLAVCSFVGSAVTVLFIAPPIAAALPEWCLNLLLGAGLWAVYFAVLVRDVTGVISETLTARLGSSGGGGGGSSTSSEGGSSSLSAPPATRDLCALCGGHLKITDEGSVVEEGGDAAAGGALAAAAASGRSIAVRRADGRIVLLTPEGVAAAAAADARRRAVTQDEHSPKTLRFDGPDGSIMFQLTCKHTFHRRCLAGWFVSGGKKATCPCCSERVEVGAIYASSPLVGKTTALFGQLLDLCRYLVVWQPLVFLLLRLSLYTSGVMSVIEGHAAAVANASLHHGEGGVHIMHEGGGAHGEFVPRHAPRVAAPP